MERVTDYRALIETWLLQQSQIQPINSDIEVQTIFDRARDRYLLVDLGWDGHRRVYNCVFHLEIKDGKIWIQRNQTDKRVAEELLEMGVAKEDIVLGLQPSYVREYTGFGVA
ncbi:XisI protein [Lusitaniella coriacea]|uniref:XisI protein n=1 Tax=Lusitaniella coriacea TaxID=1983105 RepID=UPI003CF97B81